MSGQNLNNGYTNEQWYTHVGIPNISNTSDVSGLFKIAAYMIAGLSESILAHLKIITSYII